MKRPNSQLSANKDQSDYQTPKKNNSI